MTRKPLVKKSSMTVTQRDPVSQWQNLETCSPKCISACFSITYTCAFCCKGLLTLIFFPIFYNLQVLQGHCSEVFVANNSDYIYQSDRYLSFYQCFLCQCGGIVLSGYVPFLWSPWQKILKFGTKTYLDLRMNSLDFGHQTPNVTIIDLLNEQSQKWMIHIVDVVFKNKCLHVWWFWLCLVYRIFHSPYSSLAGDVNDCFIM